MGGLVLLRVLLSSKETRRSVANGLSPGFEEQSEYFDATENPLFKDKRQEQDDEDSGVDNASQILRETSVSYFSCFITLYYRKLENFDVQTMLRCMQTFILTITKLRIFAEKRKLY